METAAAKNPDALTFEGPAIRVQVMDGPHAGESKDVQGAEFIIGSAEDCDLRLNRDSAVSRMHCMLRGSGVEFQIVDRESRNGTFIDNVRVHTAWLYPGARIRVGNSILQAQSLSVAEEVAAAGDAAPAAAFLVGKTPEMRKVHSLIGKIAKSGFPTLIQAASGTGKEKAAQALHAGSRRSDREMLVLDCSAIAETLLEAELFGHARGSFSGAGKDRPGIFESANGSTVFLDEVGELPLTQQAKLLRVLESRTVRRVGTSHAVDVDVRIIAATNRDLLVEVKEGRFRQDLYYRLHVASLTLPTLQQHVDDIPLLIEHWVKLKGDFVDATVEQFARAIPALKAHDWPGNVRELRNVLLRCLLMADGEPVTEKVVREAIDSDPGRKLFSPSVSAEDRRAQIIAALRSCNGVIAAAARALGLHGDGGRQILTREMKKLGIEAKEER